MRLPVKYNFRNGSLRLLLFFCFVILCFASCATQTMTETKTGPHVPVIERYFCPATIRSGDVLKFFLSGKDDAGDLGYIAVDIWHQGAGEDTSPYIILPAKYRERVSGYVYLFTPQSVLFGETIKISVALVDRAGNRSNTVSQTVYFGNTPPPVCPPGWEEECNKPLGPIRILLRPFQQPGFATVPPPL